ncbi:mannan-binding lectin [Sphingomonas sp.]|uniref:mannan-binding lectin n=1 Tax=Sphingomonas sp. TaxID=28214 RepID=UPI001EBFBE67|nr:mannan-binding lectin [Sphingomonas sp.]MBX3594433.1 mannan-binding lectin [Sphingomonas sp.]
MATTKLRIAAFALAHLTGIGAIMVSAPAAAQNIEPGTNGRNVTSADYPGGRFVAAGNGDWVELDARGRVAFRFRETARDAWSVYLTDAGRGIDIQIDIFRKMITIAENRGPRRDLYRITSAGRSGPYYRDERPGGREGDRGGDRGGGDRDGRGGWRDRWPTFDILAGPIWNQGDAVNKCRALAERAGGEWTGQWRTLINGRESVCEIRFARR